MFNLFQMNILNKAYAPAKIGFVETHNYVFDEDFVNVNPNSVSLSEKHKSRKEGVLPENPVKIFANFLK